VRLVVALGGNALLRRDQPAEAHALRKNVDAAVRSIAEFLGEHEVIVTHGNGPQVGLLAVQGEAYKEVGAYPLDVLGAETEGMIGYLLEQSLRNALPGREVATLLTQVVVDPTDPAFRRPTKPIGRLYEEATARRLGDERGWSVAPDGPLFRRVVPSPEPREIVELSAIRALLKAGVVVICAGGGGIPVTVSDGVLRGVEAVVDKDLAATLLAREIGAQGLLLFTDVDAVYRRFGTAQEEPIDAATIEELRLLKLDPGSMGPKVEAACRFVEGSRGLAAIGSLLEASAVLRGEAGTRVLAA
jgi:carbamate kinase